MWQIPQATALWATANQEGAIQSSIWVRQSAEHLTLTLSKESEGGQ